MSTTAIVTVTPGGQIVSAKTNYQGFLYDPASGVCTTSNRRCLEKWLTVKEVFLDLMEGHSFMDIGANLGYFCFKALEWGATKSIGLEKHLPYHQAMMEALLQVPVPRLEWVNGEWPATGHRADVVMILSVIHHLFPRTSLEQILDDLWQSSNQWVIAEWIARDDKQVQRKGFAVRRPEYNQEHFLALVRERFSSVEFLGNGHHDTRFVYLLEK